jgi:Na+-driven multidrug efflux pump
MLSRSLMGVVLMRIVALSGMAAVAGYGIGLRFHMIVLMPAFALGNAAATMVGQNLGAGNPVRADQSARTANRIGLVIMLVLAGCLTIFAVPLVRFFGSEGEVMAAGVSFLRMVSPFYLFAVPAIIFGRALQGAGDTMPSMIITIACLWGLQVPLAIGLSKAISPAIHGVWWSIGATSAVHGLLTAAWFQRGSWKRRSV